MPYMNLLKIDLEGSRGWACIHHEHGHAAGLATSVAVWVAQTGLLAPQLIALAAVALRVTNLCVTCTQLLENGAHEAHSYRVEWCMAVGAAGAVPKGWSVVVDCRIPTEPRGKACKPHIYNVQFAVLVEQRGLHGAGRVLQAVACSGVVR